MIGAVLKAIDVLQAFSPAEPHLTLGEISQRLGLPKSTTHNLLATLASRGLVERVDGGSYALGNAIIALAHAARVNVELRDRAAPFIREFAYRCRESVYLTVLDRGYSLYIYAVESPRRLLAGTAVGQRVPPHCTAVGKAMLAFLPRAQVDEIVGTLGLHRFTPHTLTDADALHAELAETRARGYSVDREEHELGTFCVGAPILDRRGRLVAACSISGPDREIVASRLPELSSEVMQTAQEISRLMGYVPGRAALGGAEAQASPASGRSSEAAPA